MQYRYFGRTGMEVSPLCLGCMNFGGATPEAESIEIILKAHDAGIQFFDTANVYSRGRSEEILGKALLDHNLRERSVVATKVHGAMGDGPNMQGNHRMHIIKQCEASLKRLKTDWIDLYQVHRPDSHIPIDETLRALDDLICAGKVRYIGLSMFGGWRIMESLWVSKELGLNRVVSEQPVYNMLERGVENELLPAARSYGVAVIPFSPLAGGLLTGKYEKDRDMPSGTRWGNIKNPAHRAVPEKFWEIQRALKKLAADRSCSMSQLALAWVVYQPGITSAIIGPRTMEQFDDNLKSLDVSMDEEINTTVDSLIPPGQNLIPWYQLPRTPNAHPWV